MDQKLRLVDFKLLLFLEEFASFIPPQNSTKHHRQLVVLCVAMLHTTNRQKCQVCVFVRMLWIES